MENMIGLMFLAFLLSAAVKAYRVHSESKLRKENPEVWLRKQELEQKEKDRQHERTKIGVGIGHAVGKAIFNRYMN